VWHNRYAEVVPLGKQRIVAQPGVALMFHSVLDGRLAILPGTVEAILNSDPDLNRAVLERWGEVPDEINNPADLILDFVASFGDGRAAQRMIRSESVFNWVLDRFGYDELALGGTSANMSIAVSALGAKRVLVYANPLTRPLADAFPLDEAIQTISHDGDIAPPRSAYRGDDVFAIHWIFEYKTGDTMTIGPHSLVAPRANRFIPSWNPANNQISLSNGFTKRFLEIAPEFSHLMVSGFHILSDQYPDGSTANDCVRPVAEYLDAVHKAAPSLRMHCELASIAGGTVRRSVREHILPQMDSVGLNEAELVTWLGDFDQADLADRIDRDNAPDTVFEGAMALAEATGVPRVHLHNLGYYIVIVDPARDDPEAIRTGLLTGATAAAIRAATGRPARHEELHPSDEHPMGDASHVAMITVGERIGAGMEFAESGIGTYRGKNVIMVPTRIVENPVRTVGLGDTISSASWLAES
jgi:ADP-dependent phosphofructokinase/glucokinase